MVKKPVKFDPDDGLIIGEVGPWATEKHERLRKYIQASHGARARFLRPQGTAGASLRWRSQFAPEPTHRFEWISSGRQVRPPADKCDRKHGIRMFGCQSPTGRG
jgi:hypothetical protein